MRLPSALSSFIAIAILGLVTALWTPTVQAREFLCTVSLNYQQLGGSGFTFLDDLKELIEEYVNENSWTDDRFLEEELIDCSLQIIFQEALTLTSFRAQLIVTSSRPIYGTTAQSPLFQINDGEWQFEFSQGTPLIFETERFNALSSLIDYYVYVMLGYDYDSFSEFGGEDYFQKARRILELAQAQNAIGWGGLSGGTRDQLVGNMLDPRFKPLRQSYFKYHFDGLDHFTTETQSARVAVLEVLTVMQELYDALARQYTTDIFFSTKYREITAIFQQSRLSAQAYALLSEVDPSHLTTYNELVQL